MKTMNLGFNYFMQQSSSERSVSGTNHRKTFDSDTFAKQTTIETRKKTRC